jgi:hypothetical protein
MFSMILIVFFLFFQIGDFKTGDKVRVIKDIRLWHIKEYLKEGFISKGFEGLYISH